MDELGIDPLLLGNYNDLRKELIGRVSSIHMKNLIPEKLNEK
jgi:hypothetical protein